MNERKGEVFSIAEENAPVEARAARSRRPLPKSLGVESPISPFQPERTSAPKHTTTINSG